LKTEATKLKITCYASVFPSKKNQKQLVYIKGKAIIISSNKYTAWEKEFGKTIMVWKLEQEQKNKVVFPIRRCAASVFFYYPNNRRLDLTNKVEGIFDSLVKYGVLDDDCWQILNPISISGDIDKTKPRCDIYLSNIIDSDI